MTIKYRKSKEFLFFALQKWLAESVLTPLNYVKCSNVFVHEMPRKILSLIFQILVKSIVLIECCQQHFCSVQCLTMSTISYPFFKMFSLCVCLQFKLLIYVCWNIRLKFVFIIQRICFIISRIRAPKICRIGNVVNESAHELCLIIIAAQCSLLMQYTQNVCETFIWKMI